MPSLLENVMFFKAVSSLLSGFLVDLPFARSDASIIDPK